MFGTLGDFEALVSRAHELGLRVMIDLVLSHTSDQHRWFHESRSSRDNPKADWYVWADPKPDGTHPNNWLSIFGGRAWEWDGERMQYYLHNFLPSQPDLNFHNPEVQDELLDVARFWLDRHVDGFRFDTINFYFHDAEVRDNPGARARAAGLLDRAGGKPLQLAGASLHQEPPGEPGIPAADAGADGRVSCRSPPSAKWATPSAAWRSWANTPPAATRCTCATPSICCRRTCRPATASRACSKQFLQRGRRWLGLLGLFQPRRRAPRLALGPRRCAAAALPRDPPQPARLGLPLPGRGTGAARGLCRLRGSPGSLWQAFLAEVPRARRLPHADGLVERQHPCRLLRGEALAAGRLRTASATAPTCRAPTRRHC